MQGNESGTHPHGSHAHIDLKVSLNEPESIDLHTASGPSNIDSV
jgi:hypothetical protein